MRNSVVLMNRAVEDMLGVRLSEVLDQPIELAIKENSLRERIITTLKKRITGHAFDFELPDAESEYPRIMRARTSVILNKEGQQSGIITIIHDVTHEREVDRMKTEFISTAAHELRTPLTSIQGFSEILMTRDNLDEAERIKFLGHINRQASTLAEIINDLLDISRLESGRGFALNFEACDVGFAIRSIVEPIMSRLDSHSFKVSLPKKPQQLIVDKDKMEQVLENLVSNAIKYSPAGSEIKVSGRVKKGWYEIIVEDAGIGMTAEQLGHIYDKFYRADSSNTAVEGTGLGMSIVQAIIDGHSGKIDISSKIGVGTKVTVSLPLPVDRPAGDEMTSERAENEKLDAV
ncbi:MAG: PAS domain-containing protein [Candidatus Marinimicrobia bacterium]|nr:PAS domain-containing protein [Candidatus Neomarinimicrobiota bacterium]